MFEGKCNAIGRTLRLVAARQAFVYLGDVTLIPGKGQLASLPALSSKQDNEFTNTSRYVHRYLKYLPIHSFEQLPYSQQTTEIR